MADLSQLMGIAPNTAAFMMGQNQAQSRESERLRQQELAETIAKMQAEASLAQQMNPLKVEQQRLANQTTQAGLPGVEADSALRQLKARLGQGTIESDISAGVSQNQEQVSKNQESQRARVGKAFLQLAPELDTIPNLPGQRAARIRTFLTQELGMPESHPQYTRLMDVVKNTPSADLSKVLTNIGASLARQDPGYIKAIDLEKMQQAGANRRQGMSDAASMAREKFKVESKKDTDKNAIKDWEDEVALQLRKAAGDPVKMYSILRRAETLAGQSGFADKAQKYATQADDIESVARAKLDASRAGKPDPAAMGVETLPPTELRSGKAPTQQHSLSDVSKLYPGVPPEKLREAYKKKFGVDLK